MKTCISRFLLASALSGAAFAAPVPSADGFKLGSGDSYLVPFDLTIPSVSHNIELSAYTGGLFLYSGQEGQTRGDFDGGVTLYGNPVDIVLASDDGYPDVDRGTFAVWRSSKFFTGSPSDKPLFKIDSPSQIATFESVDVQINDGTLSVAGSPVVSQADLGTALLTATPPTASTAWSSAFLSRGTSTISVGSGATASLNSIALGANAIGSGPTTISIGSSSQATHVNSAAIGRSSLAGGTRAFAGGYSAQATNTSAVALGDGAQATGLYSTALGSGTHANGERSVSLGGFADGKYSLAAMAGQATGNSSIALGGWASIGGAVSSPGPNSSLGNGSVAIGGVKNTATGTSSYAMGLFTAADAAGAISLGSGNVGGGSATTWVDEDPLLELGNAQVDPLIPAVPASRSNAIVTLKNGRTTLVNKAWKAATDADADTALDDPASATDSHGEALVVDGHTRLRGKVVIEQPQGDISMGIYE
jgi:hypothetical protein